MKRLPRLAFVFLLALVYWQLQAPPPKIPGTPGGPPVTSPRIRLKDGRHLAYHESGVPREQARYRIIFMHGFDSCRYDVLRVSPELARELGIYLLSFDRPGYGESDPHPARTEKSVALDIEQLADALELGPRFYLTGFSMGGEIMWSCLKYIPHRYGRQPLVWILRRQEDHGLNFANLQAFGRSHPGPCGQFLVVRVPCERDPGRLERAAGAGQVGRGRGAPRALAHLLVERPEAVPGLQRHRLQPGHHVPGRHGTHPHLRLQNPHRKL